MGVPLGHKLKIIKNITCPSASPQREAPTTNARPVAFNIISKDINTKIKLRLVSTPTKPSKNNIVARISPCSKGIACIMTVIALFPCQVECAHQTSQQQHRSQFHRQHIRTEKSDTYLFCFHHGVSNSGVGRHQTKQQFNQ